MALASAPLDGLVPQTSLEVRRYIKGQGVNPSPCLRPDTGLKMVRGRFWSLIFCLACCLTRLISGETCDRIDIVGVYNEKPGCAPRWTVEGLPPSHSDDIMRPPNRGRYIAVPDQIYVKKCSGSCLSMNGNIKHKCIATRKAKRTIMVSD